MRPASLELLEKSIFQVTGETAEILRETPLCQRRRTLEKKFGKPFRFSRLFPFIGRGHVLHDRTLSGEEANALLDHALRHEQ